MSENINNGVSMAAWPGNISNNQRSSKKIFNEAGCCGSRGIVSPRNQKAQSKHPGVALATNRKWAAGENGVNRLAGWRLVMQCVSLWQPRKQTVQSADLLSAISRYRRLNVWRESGGISYLYAGYHPRNNAYQLSCSENMAGCKPSMA
jgi:hypothetical protein